MMRPLPLLLYLVSRYAGANSIRQENSLNLSQWTQGNEADANHLLSLSIALKIQNIGLGVETLLRISDPSSIDYGQHLSAKDVALMFAPKPSAVTDVVNWLVDSGIDQNHVKISYGGDRLSLDLCVQEATMLLNTTFYHQTHKETGQEQIACQHYHVPKPIAGSIDYILAVAPVSTHQLIPRQQVVLDEETTTSAPPSPYCLNQTNLSCLRSLYKIPEDIVPHPNNSFGVYQPNWISWLAEDLDEFFYRTQPNLVGHRPKVESVNGGELQRNHTSPNYNQEPDLDFEYTMALTSPQEVTNIEAAQNFNDMLAAFDKYYCDPINPRDEKYPLTWPPGCNVTTCDCGSLSPPKVLSISWGWREAAFTPNYLQRQCLELLKLGLMGTTVLAGTGDHGTASYTENGLLCLDDTSGNATNGRFSPLFPASCPWVTSVGGTQMPKSIDLRMSAATTNETTFRLTYSDGQKLSSGGGFSNVFTAPPYQIPNVALYKELEKDHLDSIQDRFNSIGRGYPDVAARADDYSMVLHGKWRQISGTSASTPVFASIITLINSERMHAGKGSVGFINPVLYGNSDVLNDIVTGANRGCGVDPAFRAARGWDAVTGLGSPDYERLRSLFMSLP